MRFQLKPKDAMLIDAWIDSLSVSPTSAKDKRSDAELVAVYAATVSADLTTLTSEQFLAFIALLQDPPAQWLAQPGTRPKRLSAQWRPLQSAWSDMSVNRLHINARQLYRFLEKGEYVASVPAAILDKSPRLSPRHQMRSTPLPEPLPDKAFDAIEQRYLPMLKKNDPDAWQRQGLAYALCRMGCSLTDIPNVRLKHLTDNQGESTRYPTHLTFNGSRSRIPAWVSELLMARSSWPMNEPVLRPRRGPVTQPVGMPMVRMDLKTLLKNTAKLSLPRALKSVLAGASPTMLVSNN